MKTKEEMICDTDKMRVDVLDESIESYTNANENNALRHETKEKLHEVDVVEAKVAKSIEFKTQEEHWDLLNNCGEKVIECEER